MRKVKQFIKQILTIFYHPILSLILYKRGVRNFVLGSNLNINNVFLLKLGNNVTVLSNSRFMFVKEYYGKTYKPILTIKDSTQIGYHFTCLCSDTITIGKNCLIASNVFISSENHGISIDDDLPYYEQPLVSKPVEIGDGCWLGEKVSILPGVKLGEKCIVGAGSVVTKSFPPCSMIAGNPAKLLKRYNFNSHCWEKA